MLLATYCWRRRPGFLCDHLYPDAVAIHARLGEKSAKVLSRLPRGTTHFLFHLDLTDTRLMPYDRRNLIAQLQSRGIEVWNGEVVDVGKQLIQQTNLRLGLPTTSAPMIGDPEEFVIVKTNANYGGFREKKLSHMARRRLRLNIWRPPIRGPLDYRVIERRQVPVDWWAHPQLAIERLVTNSLEVFHRAYVLLDRCVISTVTDRELLKKMPIGIARQNAFFCLSRDVSSDSSPLRNPASQIARFVSGLGLQFGAVDIVQSETGEYYIINVNTTPFWGDEFPEELVEFLRC